MDVKVCAICKHEKPIEEFGVNRKCADGKHYYCKRCECDRHKMYYDWELRDAWLKEKKERDKDKVIYRVLAALYENYWLENDDIMHIFKWTTKNQRSHLNAILNRLHDKRLIIKRQSGTVRSGAPKYQWKRLPEVSRVQLSRDPWSSVSRKKNK
jgi:hypothetical protein